MGRSCCDQPVHVDALPDNVFRVQFAGLAHLADLADDGGGGGGHHRPEVARGLAVDEVAQVGAVCLDQGNLPVDGAVQDVSSAVDLAGSLLSASGVPAPARVKKASIPAPVARIRLARLPCGTSSSSISPAR